MPLPRSRYPSDLSDEEWAILGPLLSTTEKRGRPAQVVAKSGGRRRLLLPAIWLLMADALVRVPTLADGLLPFPQVEARRSAQEGTRAVARRGARNRGTRSGP